MRSRDPITAARSASLGADDVALSPGELRASCQLAPAGTLGYAPPGVSDRPFSPRESSTTAIDRPARAPLGVVVRVLGAPAEPASRPLRSGTIILGAGGGADVLIGSDTVSRAHVEMSLVEEGVRVRDLGSRNGTFYLGQRVETMILAPGSRLKLGAVEVVIEPDLSTLEPDDTTATSYRGLRGSAPASRRLFAMLARLEGSLVNVVVTGESGVGKELIAAGLHEGSAVSGGPFVAKNCGALSRELVQSELFGHKKGAFTGAIDARAGAFESANGGTLFLDEIGELPLDVQPVLLRALETGEITPIGADRAARVKVRVVAATNRNLEEQVREGSFRSDLYYRLAVVQIRVAPLRERREDIEVLARHFAALAGIGELPADIVETWRAQPWPGNARELRNAVQSFAALGGLPDAGPLSSVAAPAVLRGLVDLDRPFMDQRDAVSDAFTSTYLAMLLEKTRGNQSEASRISGVERSHLRKLLIKHGLLKG
jgi:DNA-binding NtrC family response regulator